MTEIKKVGIVAMPRISVGGGFARAARDLIAALNSMGKEIHLLTPFEVDLNKIAELYGPVKIASIRYPSKRVTFFARDDVLGRKLLKKEFKKLARDVDFIIDLDGGVLHNYLPDGFDKRNYVVWRLSCINPETYKLQGVKDFKVLAKILIKKTVKKIIRRTRDVPRGFRIYPLDEWTKRELMQFWSVSEKDMPFCLYPEIKVDEFEPKKKRKKQMAVLGRIAPNKSVDESVRIFAAGTAGEKDYKLVILGGVTPDSLPYIELLKNISRELGIEDKVEIIGDPSFSKIKDVLSESEVLIDSQKGVSLTMTAIEAMASGCIVLAQKNAGTYQEVLEQGKYGYGFSSVDEGISELKKIVSALKTRKLTNRGAIERAEFFSSRSFINRLKAIVA